MNAPFETRKAPLVEAGGRRQIVGRERAGAVHRRVDPEPVAEVYQQRHHLALLVAQYLEG